MIRGWRLLFLLFHTLTHPAPSYLYNALLSRPKLQGSRNNVEADGGSRRVSERNNVQESSHPHIAQIQQLSVDVCSIPCGRRTWSGSLAIFGMPRRGQRPPDSF